MEHNASRATDSVADSDEAARTYLSRTLFVGLMLSIAIMAVGSALVALDHRAVATRAVPLDRVLGDLAGGSRAALIDWGILLLFATPVAGVLAMFFHFVHLRERTFTVITGALLLMLVLGFVVALH